MKCPQCDNDIVDDSKFCKECGTNLTSAEEAQPAITKTIETRRDELTTGSTFAGRYQVIEELGKGGMGRVYKVIDTEINEKMALKLIKPEIASDQKTIERFRNELTTARKISQKNVCRMYDLNKEQNNYYITMEFVSGGDLKKFIRRSKQLTIRTAISIVKQICDGLSEAHELGIVHRDLKPNNIMIDDNGNVRIMDFGIARSLKAKSMTGPGVMIGTPEYMAPEQVEGKDVDQRSDIYALGIVLYEMLTGQLPFSGDNPFTIGIKQKSEMPEDPKNYNASIPEDLSRLILKCLEKKPDSRYQTARELRSELSIMEQAVPTTERKLSERKPLTSKELTVTIGLKKLYWPILVAAALVVISVLIWKVLPHKESIPPIAGKPSVAIMYFKNNTGDAGLEHWRHALADLLITDLSQSKFVHVLSEDKLFNILGELDQLEAKNFSSDVLREVASRGKVNHILVGSFTRAGDIFRMNITLQTAAAGEVIGSESVEGTGEQSFYTMVDELTRRIKTQFALSRGQLSSDIDRRVGEITTSNPKALKFYIEGRQHHLNYEYRDSIQAMENAIAIDPDFAMAYRSLAMSHNNLFLYAQRTRYIQKAMELSERLPDRERYQIMGDFYSDSESTYDKAIEAYSSLLELYPDNLTAINNLGLIYSGIGEREKGVEYYEEAIHKGDRSAVAYTNLASAYGGIGRYDEAKQLLENYIETILDLPSIRNSLGQLYIQQGKLELALVEVEKAFLLDPSSVASFLWKGLIYRFMGDTVKAEVEFQKARQHNELIGKIAGGAYLAYLYSEQGRFSEAMNVTNQGFEIVKKAGLTYWITRYHLGFSRSHLRTGQPQKALNEAEQAFVLAADSEDLENMRNALYQKSLALLDLGEVSEAEKTANQLKELIEAGMNKRIIRLYYHLKGDIELQKGNHSQAVDFSQQALDLLGYGPLTIDAGYINTLALAYYRSGELNQALSEYERITSLIDGRLERGDIYAKSFYMLGKIYEQQGDTAKAKENYEKFLVLWKDADPGFPEVADAKERVAALGAGERSSAKIIQE